MTTRQDLLKKWEPILEHKSLPEIKDNYRKEVTAILLENQEREMKKGAEALFEAAPANSGGIGIALGGAGDATGTVAGFDPVLIALVRRAMPQMIAYDIAGVQPMTQPTGLIFAMKSRYTTQGGSEALFNEADSAFAGATGAAQSGTGPFDDNVIGGMSTATAEALGSTPADFHSMAFSIEKTSVTAKTRALKAEYSIELAQDLKAVHGLDAEGELSKILSTEILAEINREVIRTIYTVAVPGAQYGTTTAGWFDLDTDSNGRWSVERFKGLIFQIERDANVIAKQTRRGKGNVLIVSSDVASAMAMAGVLQYTPALQADLQVDDTGNTFCGLLHGRIKVYIDPYFGGYTANQELVTVGYKGSSPYDAGLFYCPYVPLQMVRAVDQFTFQPKIGFKTRYGMVANPFAEGIASSGDYGVGMGHLNARSNKYYRIFGVKNLM